MRTNTSALQKAKYKLKILDAEKADDTKKKKKVIKQNDEYLLKAISSAMLCTEYIQPEQTRLKELIAEYQNQQDTDKYWEIKSNYYKDQIEIIEETYPLFSAEAKRRKNLIQTINSTGQWEIEREKCKEDTLYWFDNYAWTSDPRKVGIWSLPFILYPYQREAVTWLEDLIFSKKTSGVIEKSRDLGFSWLLISLFYKHFQHSEGFHALIGSITANECDTIGDPSSMFEKIREQARLQPVGLLPSGWDRNISYMKAINPVTKSTITGSTSNADFGRGGRFSCILFDEFSSFEMDTAAMTASSQSSPCKIYNSTAKGMGNEFYRLANSGKIEKKTFHWTVHPYKTQSWYDYQKIEMSDIQIAQELDINYESSQHNKVYSEYQEHIHVVTKSEVIRALPSFGDMHGNFRIPFGHSIYMGEDVGQTEEHAHMMLWFATLKENTITTDGIDLSGSVLIYRELQQSPKSPPRIWAESIKKAEGDLEKNMVSGRFISHEAVTEAEIYSDEYGLNFINWKPDYTTGISRVKDYLDVVFKESIHPFREYTRKQKYPNAPPILGRPHIYIVVDDEQGELLFNESTNSYSIIPAKDNNGFIRTRFEFPLYHYPQSELGKEVKRMRPRKKDDDALDVIRCIATECFPPVNKENRFASIEKELPSGLRLDSIRELPTESLGMAFLQRNQQIREKNKHLESIGINYRDQLIKDRLC